LHFEPEDRFVTKGYEHPTLLVAGLVVSPFTNQFFQQATSISRDQYRARRCAERFFRRRLGRFQQ
jgi:hypothetical protein